MHWGSGTRKKQIKWERRSLDAGHRTQSFKHDDDVMAMSSQHPRHVTMKSSSGRSDLVRKLKPNICIDNACCYSLRCCIAEDGENLGQPTPINLIKIFFFKLARMNNKQKFTDKRIWQTSPSSWGRSPTMDTCSQGMGIIDEQGADSWMISRVSALSLSLVDNRKLTEQT